MIPKHWLWSQDPYPKHGMVRALWKCKCDCGTICFVTTNALRAKWHKKKGGNTQSCGCLRIEHAIAQSKFNRKHGHTVDGKQSKTWVSWWAMVQRCLYPNFKGFKRYGGATPPVRITRRWLGVHGFENFLADLGPRRRGTTLGRFGDVGNYRVGNCQWQTRKQQEAEHAKKRGRR